MRNIWYERIVFWDSLADQIKYMVVSRGLRHYVRISEIMTTFKEMDYDQDQGFLPAMTLVDEFLREVERRATIS